MVCDVCGKPGNFKHVSANTVKKAVSSGFNPYESGLIDTGFLSFSSVNIKEAGYQQFKNIAANSSTAWNICPKCESELSKYC